MPKTLPMVDISAPVCCAPVAAGPLDDGAALEIALRLKALADPVRVKLVSLLFGSGTGEACSCDLAAAVDLSESTVSHHLSQLRRRTRGVRAARRERLSQAAPRRPYRVVLGAGPEPLRLTRNRMAAETDMPAAPRTSIASHTRCAAINTGRCDAAG